MSTNILSLNILNFSHTEMLLTVYISENKTNNCIYLSKYDCESLAHIFGKEKELFATTEPTDGSTAVTKATSPEHCSEGESPWSLSFLKKYYTRCLTNYFRAKGYPAQTNFVSDTEVWIKDKSAYPGCDGYRVFTLRIQFSKTERKPELLVAMGDIRSVYKKSVNNPVFSEISEKEFNWVFFRNQLYKHEFMPEAARRHQDEVFPCMSFGLLDLLKISHPAPEKTNKYLKYSQEIEIFRKNYLEEEALQNFMAIEKKWKQVQPERLAISETNMLRFGEGEHAEPKYGLKQFGPRELITDEIVFFFILHVDYKPLAFSINEYLAGKRSEFPAGVNGFLRMKYNTEPFLSIVFSDKENPLSEIEEKLKLKKEQFDSSKRYVAIYLSPYSKWDRSVLHKSIYYRLKEMLLIRGIVSQTIDADKTWGKDKQTVQDGDNIKAVIKEGFHYSLPNILTAIYAKLGATPWCLEKQPTEELVIGISAYRSKDLNKNYLGSAFSFTNEGRFQGFECFRHNQLTELAGSIALTVEEYCNEHQNLSRLVIHFYKRLSKRELKPIEKALAELELDVSVIVVSVNKGYSDDIVGFDNSKPHKMPVSGTYLALEYNQYLLFNNQLQQGTEKINDREGYPFPLKIRIQQFLPDKNTVIQPEPADAVQLLTQVCRFSQLYWKSVSRQWMPVTLRYPELLAQIVPHFKHLDLPDMGRENLWFL